MKTYFVDTNIFLRVIIKENETSYKESSLFFKIAEENKIRIVTSNFVLAEIAWVMESFYKLDKEKIVAALKGIRVLKNIKFADGVNFDKAISIFSKVNVKYIDALIASNKNINLGRWKIVSYDKDFDKIGVARLEPSKLINEFFN